MGKPGRNPWGEATAAGAASEALSKREQILNAATRVFARKGYFGSRVADVAREAGIAYGLIYHYFHNKEEVLIAIFHEAWTSLLDRIRQTRNGSPNAEEKLREIVRFLLTGFQRNPELMEVLVIEVIRSSKLLKSDILERIREAFRLLEEIVEEGKVQGVFRRELDSRLACTILYGAIDQIITEWVLRCGPSEKADVDRALEMVDAIILRGMSPGH